MADWTFVPLGDPVQRQEFQPPRTLITRLADGTENRRQTSTAFLCQWDEDYEFTDVEWESFLTFFEAHGFLTPFSRLSYKRMSSAPLHEATARFAEVIPRQSTGAGYNAATIRTIEVAS